MQRLFLSHDGDPISAVTTQEMFELLRYTVKHETIGPEELVESAGRSAYAVAWRFISKQGREKPVIVLAGTGYTGAVALALARHLSNHGVTVDYLLKEGTQVPVGVRQRNACLLSHCRTLEHPPEALERYGVVIDALTGLSASEALDQTTKQIVDSFQSQGATTAEGRRTRSYKLISFEAPTGVDASTGVAGATAIWADTSIAFALPKTGMGAAECGSVTVADIGVPRGIYQKQATVAHPCEFRGNFAVPLQSMPSAGSV